MKPLRKSTTGDSRFKEQLAEKAPDEHVVPARPLDEADVPQGRRLVVIPALPPTPPRPARPSRVFTRPAAPDPNPFDALAQPQRRQQASRAPQVTVTPIRFWFLSAGILVGVLASTMALFSVATSLHKIANEFKALVSVTWVLLAYVLAECCCGLVFSGVSDVVGRRNAFVSALVIFCLASMAAGFTANLIQLVLARAAQGIGGSGLFHVSLAVVQETCPDNWQTFAISAQIAVFAVGCFLGPLLGGLFNLSASWRWVSDSSTSGPLCLISFVMVLVAWPPRSQRARFRRTTWKVFDYAGAVLLVCTLFLFVFAFQNVGLSVSAAAWASPLFLAPFVVAVCFSVVLFILEHRASRGLTELRAPAVIPIFPLALLRNRHVASAAATALFLGLPVLTLLLTVPLRCELVSKKPPAVAALMLLPAIATAALGSAASAFANWKHNALYATALGGPLIALAGCGLLCTVRGASDDAKLLGFLALVGLGAGMSMTSCALTTGFFVLPESYVPAIGMFSQFRLFGGCLGIAAFSILLHNQILTIFPFPITPEMLAMLSDSKSAIPINLELFMARGVDGAFHSATKICAAMAGAAVLSALFAFPERSAHRTAGRAAAVARIAVETREGGAGPRGQERQERQESQEMHRR
ncbi:putative transporter [Escovopsis weberi]|uniref:Putative transporter n=1 Tax=Escovopsis weberi TaxID=150374 RepID=A0A0M9VV32_ESCWE|nr:putative transporter [Escovopsis weberi]